MGSSTASVPPDNNKEVGDGAGTTGPNGLSLEGKTGSMPSVALGAAAEADIARAKMLNLPSVSKGVFAEDIATTKKLNMPSVSKDTPSVSKDMVQHEPSAGLTVSEETDGPPFDDDDDDESSKSKTESQHEVFLDHESVHDPEHEEAQIRRTALVIDDESIDFTSPPELQRIEGVSTHSRPGAVRVTNNGNGRRRSRWSIRFSLFRHPSADRLVTAHAVKDQGVVVEATLVDSMVAIGEAVKFDGGGEEKTSPYGDSNWHCTTQCTIAVFALVVGVLVGGSLFGILMGDKDEGQKAANVVPVAFDIDALFRNVTRERYYAAIWGSQSSCAALNGHVLHGSCSGTGSVLKIDMSYGKSSCIQNERNSFVCTPEAGTNIQEAIVLFRCGDYEPDINNKSNLESTIRVSQTQATDCFNEAITEMSALTYVSFGQLCLPISSHSHEGDGNSPPHEQESEDGLADRADLSPTSSPLPQDGDRRRRKLQRKKPKLVMNSAQACLEGDILGVESGEITQQYCYQTDECEECDEIRLGSVESSILEQGRGCNFGLHDQVVGGLPSENELLSFAAMAFKHRDAFLEQVGDL